MAGEPLIEHIGQALRDARKASGLTLREAAARSSGRFRPTSIARYERGERSISLVRFCHLAKVYGVGPEQLLPRALNRPTAPGRGHHSP